MQTLVVTHAGLAFQVRSGVLMIYIEEFQML